MSSERDIFLKAADRIAVQLVQDAIWDGDRCNWIGDSKEPIDGVWTVVSRTFEGDLYSGTAGIGLFLARHFQYTGESVFRTAAEGALRQAISKLPIGQSPASLGFYSGNLGTAWALLSVGEAIGQQDFVQHGLSILHQFASQKAELCQTDLVSGASGAILVLLKTAKLYGSDTLIAGATRLGESLVASAHRTGRGSSWQTIDPAYCSRHLTGLSHGTAGIALSLLELGLATTATKFTTMAEEAFAYEDGHFSASEDNWPDFRSSDTSQKPVFSMSWCHGAPGIGLARLRAFLLTGKHEHRVAAEAALRSTARSMYSPGSSPSFCLCHGLAGNAELLIYAGQVIENGEGYRAIAEQVGRAGITNYSQPEIDWPCGVPGGGETPGLMLGTAGIGYFYLRLYEPSVVPSILLP